MPKVSKHGGRRTLLTVELADEICGYVADGLSDRDASLLAGIDPQTFINWRRRGLEGEEPYTEFAKRLVVAEVKFKKRHMDNINRHSKKSPMQSQWLLERKFQSEFGLRQRLEVVDKLTEWAQAFDKI
jgi:hypothetical protein